MTLLKNRGISIIEIIIVIAIVGIISSIAVLNLSGFRDEQALKNTTLDIISLLNQARQNTISSVNSTNYGVHLETDKAILFSGSTYSPLGVSNKIFVFNPSVVIPASGGLNIGGGSDVVFERLTGDTIGSIVIELVSDNTKKKTITINKTGVISSN